MISAAINLLPSHTMKHTQSGPASPGDGAKLRDRSGKAVRRLLGMCVALVAAAVTVTPTQHDFGDVGVNGLATMLFSIRIPPSTDTTDTMTIALAGADAVDFVIRDLNYLDPTAPNPCHANLTPGTPNPPLGWRGGSCLIAFDFRPRSLGPKQARGIIADSRGGQAVVSLRGKGVAALCEMKVVSCNYAHLYSGTFSWQSDLSGPWGQTRLSVTVTVINGVATCDGSETSVTINDGGRSTDVGSIQGDGLIAIEFETDSADRPVYRVTAACPSPQWPPALNRPVQPAELGNSYFEESYQQPMPNPNSTLRGMRRGAHPDVDSVNGVTGTMTVSWTLQRS